MACVRGCPGHARARADAVTLTVAGRRLEWSKLDVGRCYHGMRGGDQCRPFNVELKPVYEYARSVCAGRGCLRSCMDHLERQGKLANKSHGPFRRGQPWTMNDSPPAEGAEKG